MCALHVPLWMQPSGADPDITPTAQEFRQLLGGLLWGIGQGVYGTAASFGGFKVVQRAAGANFSVDIAGGIASVIGDDVTGQGVYTVWNDGTVNLATPSAPGSGTRVHRLVLQVRDKLHNGAYTTYDCIPLIVQDTGGGFPAEPNSALTLASISIAAGQVSVLNANITDKRPLTGFQQPASDPVNGGPESWHTLGTPSATGYTSNHGRFRMTAEGEVEFDIELTGTSGSGTAGLYTYAVSLPSVYCPALATSPRRCVMSPNNVGNNVLSVFNSGSVTINVPATTEIHCNYRMPLD